MHPSLRGYVTIKRRPAGIYSREHGARIARLPDRSFRSCRAPGNPNRAPSNSRSSNNANMLVRGSLLWHETRTHMVGGGGVEGRREGGARGTASSAGGIG